MEGRLALFKNRSESGRRLALQLHEYKTTPELLVLGLPRGGVSVAYEIARELNAPLDVLIVRKLGAPGNEEFAIGAIAGDIRVLDPLLIQMSGISDDVVKQIEQREHQEMMRREMLYRRGRPPLDLRHKTVILVDDGLATGATMKAALFAAISHHPKKLIAALPVAAASSIDKIRSLADAMVILSTPEIFYGVGMFYDDFRQVSDDEVIHLLHSIRGGPVLENTEDQAAANASFSTLTRHEREPPEAVSALV